MKNVLKSIVACALSVIALYVLSTQTQLPVDNNFLWLGCCVIAGTCFVNA